MPEQGNRSPPHRLADHDGGADAAHIHDGDADHDHDAFDPQSPLEENPLWIKDHVALTSVGIDVGSAGTQVIFSRIRMRRLAEDLTSRYYVTARDTLFLSPVSLTPYQSETRIDDTALKAIIRGAYRDAGMDPADIDTGAVILTGEALRRENAEAILSMLAEQGGDFVCATAGHHMESMLAAYGSGAARISKEQGIRILNIDIGGGTTKLALAEDGRVIATAALHIGGRLVVVDAAGRIVRLDPAGKLHAARAGFAWNLGDIVTGDALQSVADDMAASLMAALRYDPPPGIADLFLTDPIEDFGTIGGVIFSGGVGEYIYGRETRDFADMGLRLGASIRRRFDSASLSWPLLPAGECIRATALGASEYSVQLSGNTSYISNPSTLLPRRNLQVLQPHCVLGEAIDTDAVAEAIRVHRKAFEADGIDAGIALAFHWRGVPSYARICALARGIAAGLGDKIAAGKPLHIMLDGDVAQTLGAILREDCKVASDILVIDGIMLMDFDYIDLGRLRLPSYTVPVTIKSLLFREDMRRQNGHHRHGGFHHDDHHHGHHHGP